MKKFLPGIVSVVIVLSFTLFWGCQKKEEMPKSQQPPAMEQTQPKQTEQAPAQAPAKESSGEKPAGQGKY
jgi:hypothetical protein